MVTGATTMARRCPQNRPCCIGSSLARNVFQRVGASVRWPHARRKRPCPVRAAGARLLRASCGVSAGADRRANGGSHASLP